MFDFIVNFYSAGCHNIIYYSVVLKCYLSAYLTIVKKKEKKKKHYSIIEGS